MFRIAAMPATSPRLAAQLKALLLIAMLAGHEAKRVQQEAKMAEALARAGGGSVEGSQGPEEDWRAENQACKWKTASGGCVGSTTDLKGACKYRRLPLDWPPPSDQSCRLTDDYMLEKDRSKYFRLQSELLAAKAEKFKRCKGLKIYQLSGTTKCKRRAKVMVRALEFMAKAQDSSLLESLSEAQKAEERVRFDNALKSLAESIGDDGALVLTLRAKLKGSAAMRRDPSGTAGWILGVLQKLLRGTKAEQQEARDEITALPWLEQGDGPQAPQVQELTKERSLAKEFERKPEELRDLMDEANVLDNESETDDGEVINSALLQHAEFDGAVVSKESAAVSIMAFVVIAVLVVATVVWSVAELLVAVVAWAFLAVLGCSAATVITNHAVEKHNKEWPEFDPVKKKGVTSALKCMVKVFAWPFKKIGRGIVSFWRFVSGKRSLADEEEEQEEREAHRRRGDVDPVPHGPGRP